jgi:hypothetical protein
MSKSDKKSANTSTKKKKQQPVEERSAGNPSAMRAISEGSDEAESVRSRESEVMEDEYVGEDQHPVNEFQTIMEFMRGMEQKISNELLVVRNRLSHLETPRDLDNSGYYDSPTDLKTSNSTKKSPPSMMKSFASSTAKRNWKDVQRRLHGTSSPDTTPTGSEDDDEEEEAADPQPQPRKNEQPKKSFGTLFRSLDVSQQSVSKTVVNITRVEKECNVRITDFSLAKVCKAIKSIMEFQEREGTLVNMSKVLDVSCKQHLRVRYGIETSDLSTMELSTLFSVIAMETKVHSKVEFYDALKEAMGQQQLMDWAKVSPSNHEAYYFQQLKLVDDFMTLFRIMLQENKAWCPAITDKEGGLIRLFKSFHAYAYWKHLWTSMGQRYRNMQEFIDEYLEKILEQYQLSQAFKSVPYAQATKSVDKEKQYYDKKREVSKFVNHSFSKFKDKPNHNSLNHIDTEACRHSDDSDDSTWKDANPVASSERYIGDSDDSLSDTPMEKQEDDEDQEPMHDMVLAAFADHQVKADKKDYPCLRKILSGKCDSERCPYGHRKETLLKGAADMKVKLTAFLSTAGEQSKEQSSAPYKVLSKEKQYGR